MDRAIDHTINKLIFAEQITNIEEYRRHKFLCPNCHKEVIFYQPTHQVPHFKHKVYNPQCEYSESGKDYFYGDPIEVKKPIDYEVCKAMTNYFLDFLDFNDTDQDFKNLEKKQLKSLKEITCSFLCKTEDIERYKEKFKSNLSQNVHVLFVHRNLNEMKDLYNSELNKLYPKFSVYELNILDSEPGIFYISFPIDRLIRDLEDFEFIFVRKVNYSLDILKISISDKYDFFNVLVLFYDVNLAKIYQLNKERFKNINGKKLNLKRFKEKLLKNLKFMIKTYLNLDRDYKKIMSIMTEIVNDSDTHPKILAEFVLEYLTEELKSEDIVYNLKKLFQNDFVIQSTQKFINFIENETYDEQYDSNKEFKKKKQIIKRNLKLLRGETIKISEYNSYKQMEPNILLQKATDEMIINAWKSYLITIKKKQKSLFEIYNNANYDINQIKKILEPEIEKNFNIKSALIPQIDDFFISHYDMLKFMEKQGNPMFSKESVNEIKGYLFSNLIKWIREAIKIANNQEISEDIILKAFRLK